MLKIGIIAREGTPTPLIHQFYALSGNSPSYTIVAVLLERGSPSPLAGRSSSCLSPALAHLSGTIQRQALSWVERGERALIGRRLPRPVDADFTMEAFGVPMRVLEPASSRPAHPFGATKADLAWILALELDLVFDARGGAFVEAGRDWSRMGVLSFDYLIQQRLWGRPPGFWEVFRRQAATPFRLVLQGQGSQEGVVLFQGSLATERLSTLNAHLLGLKTAHFLHQTLERLADQPGAPLLTRPSPDCRPADKLPRLPEILGYCLKTFLALFGRVLSRRMGWDYRWSVHYQWTDSFMTAALSASRPIKNPPHRYLADPFVVSHQGQTVMFVEDYDFRSRLGKITAYQLDSSGHRALGTVLEEDFHLSYPYLLTVGDDLYMIPETSASKSLRIYRAVEFPLRWALHRVIMEGVSAAESALFEWKGRYWLLTNLDSSGLDDHHSELHLFHADRFDSTDWIPHPMNPLFCELGRGRNGGLIVADGAIYRVFQRKDFDRYGASMGVAEVTELTETRYEERWLFDVPPEFLPGLCGTHTLSFAAGVLCLDTLRFESVR